MHMQHYSNTLDSMDDAIVYRAARKVRLHSFYNFAPKGIANTFVQCPIANDGELVCLRRD